MNNAIFMRIASRRTLHANIPESFPRERGVVSSAGSFSIFEIRIGVRLQIENKGVRNINIDSQMGIFAVNALAIISARRDRVEVKTHYVMRARARNSFKMHSSVISSLRCSLHGVYRSS